jgi:serine/threonine-protein kinase
MRDLDHFRAGEPLEARPDRLGYRAGKFVRRHRVPLAAAAAAAVTVTALVAFYGARLAGARNAALAEAERAQRIQSFMLSLFEGGDDEVAPPESLRVVTLLDRGVRQARLLDGEPAAQAELLQTLGEVQLGLGRLDPAESLLTAADERRRTALGAEHPDVARGLIPLAHLQLGRADYEAAETAARQALELSRRVRPAAHPDVQAALVTLGQVLSERGRYDEAIAVLEESVALRGASPQEDLDLASALHALANAHFYAGRYDVSDSLNLRVLDITRRKLGDTHPSVADNLVNLGAVRAQLGRHAEAEASYREALAVTRAWFGDDHPKTATNRTMLGRALVAQGRADEAVAELTEALAVLERVHGPVHPRVASALNELGIVAMQHGRLDEAEAAFRRMADIYRRTYGEDHDVLGVARSNVASVHMAKGEWAAAEAELRGVIALFERTLGGDHLNTGIARIKHGRALHRLERRDEARAETEAGLAVLAALGDSSSSWVKAAREDLAAAGGGQGPSAGSR